LGLSLFQSYFFEYFGWFAFVASAIFIIVQLLLLVDFAHTWAENWITKYEESDSDDSKWWWILLSTSISLLLVSTILTIVMGVFFAKDASSCQRNVAILTINSIICLAMNLLSIHPKVQDANPRSGLLQSALITAYSTYLTFSAFMSSSDSCNPWFKSSGASNISVAIGAVFTIVAVCYTTIRAASQVGELAPESQSLVKSEEDGTPDDKDKEKINDAPASDANDPVGYNFSRFHLVFALGAFYIAMLMSDWKTVYDPGQDTATVDSGLAAYWVKIVSSWICNLLYVWTLMGPVLLPDRDWS